MMKEENVDVEMHQTGEEEYKEGASVPPVDASAVLGKFRSVDALARAYESLQAEFTRRSQRLRALEKEVENFKEGSGSGAEKLRRLATARRAEEKEFDAFVAEMEKPTDGEQKPEVALEEGSIEGEAPQERGEMPTVGSGREEPSDSELFAKAFDNEAVRLKIVGEYLSSLGKSGVPLTSGGVGVLTTPTQKAKTVGEAGDMALLYFKKPNLG